LSGVAKCAAANANQDDGIVFVFSNVKDYRFTVALEADFQ